MRLDFRSIHGAQGVLVDTESDAMEAAAQALEGVYGRRPHLTRIGGSIPVVADFKRTLGLDSVLMGFGLDSDAIHSPNEHFGLGPLCGGHFGHHSVYGTLRQAGWIRCKQRAVETAGPGGGIGRRDGLKIRCPMRTCGFESHPGY